MEKIKWFVACNNCGERVELNSTRTYPITKELVCISCYNDHQEQYDGPTYKCAECCKELTKETILNCCEFRIFL